MNNTQEYYYNGKGFLTEALHANIDKSLPKISEDEHTALFAMQAKGYTIQPDENGYPIAVPPSPATAEQLADEARTQRDTLLAACDWTQMPDSPLSSEQKAAWATYRQGLRDLTEQPGFPENINWPLAPDAEV